MHYRQYTLGSASRWKFEAEDVRSMCRGVLEQGHSLKLGYQDVDGVKLSLLSVLIRDTVLALAVIFRASDTR